MSLTLQKAKNLTSCDFQNVFCSAASHSAENIQYIEGDIQV